MINKETALRTCLGLADEMTAFLDRLVRFESTCSYEGQAMHWLHEQFREISDECELVDVPEDIINDPDYSFRIDEQPYNGRPNVRAVIKGNGTGRSVIMNAHVDVVPPSVGQQRPFDPYIKDGLMYGRGTADDKGQVAVIWTLFKALRKMGVKPKGDIIAHLVIEEETGGNGTLAMIRRGEKADCCLNLEPAKNRIITSVRGAVWFEATVYGRAGHSGSAQTTVSALKMAIEAMRIIEEYHQELLELTHGEDPLFLQYSDPMPVTFGVLKAGDWPAMAPQKAEFKGVFGFLTTPKEEVMKEIVDRVKTRGPEWLKDNFEIKFTYRHDLSRHDPNHILVGTLIDSYEEMDMETGIGATPCSADTWFYNNILGIPTVITGCGKIEVCHTDHENVPLDEIIRETAMLCIFVKKWCGVTQF